MNKSLVFLFSLKYRIVNKIYNLLCSWVHKKTICIDWRSSKILNPERINVGHNFYSGQGLWLHAILPTSTLTIGDNVNISDWVHIAALERVEVGAGCLIGSRVHITDHSHGQTEQLSLLSDTRPNDRPLYSKGPVVIEENVWIGDAVVILGNVLVGKGSIIAANSVVTKDIPPYSIAAGVPAKVIRK